MGIISASRRKSLPAAEFGIPGERKYPMPDKSHAANAKARAAQQVKQGGLSEAEATRVIRKANRVLKQK
jgi:hypothetical protein